MDHGWLRPVTTISARQPSASGTSALTGAVLGSAAGMLGVYRAATGLGQTVGYRHDKQESNDQEDGGDESR